MINIPILEEEKLIENIRSSIYPHLENYYAFYSSWFGGIIKNSTMMLLPMDDHMVHRGDGVFEVMKSYHNSVYLLDEHLRRLFNSAEKIGLESPYNVEDIKKIITATLEAANQNSALVRIYLSRGAGSFSMDPYDSIKPQLYVIITKLIKPSEKKYKQGVIIGKSTIPVKDSWMAQIKSCNYLPNVLMKKEAVDRNLDYIIGVDKKNNLTEGAGENLLIVDQNNMLVHPPLNCILKGTILVRVCELARENGIAIEEKIISCEEIESAREVMMTGTSINILPVVKFENRIIGDGKPGQVFEKLNRLISADVDKLN